MAINFQKMGRKKNQQKKPYNPFLDHCSLWAMHLCNREHMRKTENKYAGKGTLTKLNKKNQIYYEKDFLYQSSRAKGVVNAAET